MSPNEMAGNVGVVQGSESVVILNPAAESLELAVKGTSANGRTMVSINGAPVYQAIFANGASHFYSRACGIRTVAMYAAAEETDQVYALSMPKIEGTVT